MEQLTAEGLYSSLSLLETKTELKGECLLDLHSSGGYDYSTCPKLQTL